MRSRFAVRTLCTVAGALVTLTTASGCGDLLPETGVQPPPPSTLPPLAVRTTTTAAPPTPAPPASPVPTPTQTVFPSATPLPSEVPNATPLPSELPTATPLPSDVPTATPVPPSLDAVTHLSDLVPWNVPAPGPHHQEARNALIDLWLLDKDLADSVARLPWIREEIDELEAGVIKSILKLARIDLELAEDAISFTKNQNWLENKDADAFYIFEQIAELDAKLAEDVMHLPWVTDGMTRHDVELLSQFHSVVVAEDLQLGRQIAAYPWSEHGMTADDLFSLTWLLVDLAVKDLELTRLVLGSPWFTDSLTDDVLNTLEVLVASPASGAELMAVLSGWSGPEVYASHSMPDISGLVHLSASHPSLGLDVMAFVSSDGGDLGIYAVNSLAEMALRSSDVFERLTTEPWFDNGPIEQKLALLVVLNRQLSDRPSLYEELRGSPLFTQSERFTQPLAGETRIWVVQNSVFPPEEDLPGVIEDAARLSEELLGVPFPTTDIILFVFDSANSRISLPARHYGSHMVLLRSRSGVLGLAQQTARYYSMSGPRWVAEGVAGLIAAQVNDHRGTQSIADRKLELGERVQSDCTDRGAENIRHLNYLIANVPQEAQTLDRCIDVMGQNLLINVYETIGEHAMSSALRDLYLSSRETESPLTDEQVYDSFLHHTASDRREAFRQIYLLLYGGAHAATEVEFDDDYGDDPAHAFDIDVGSSVEGSLDYLFDFDFFRFNAVGGTKYDIRVSHESLGDSSIALIEQDGAFQKHADWHSRTREDFGPRMYWLAPTSGEYYLAVQNFGGKTGEYKLSITPVTFPPDDHAETPGSATVISLGETVDGQMDNGFDLDCFQLHAEAGQGYLAIVEHASLDLSRIRLLDDEGPLDPSFYASGRLGDGSAMEWVAMESGPAYLVIDSPSASTGTYTLTVTTAD